MLKKQEMSWLKQFQRRMSARSSVKHPWQVIVEPRLSVELFDILEATVSRTFSDLTHQNLTKEHFLKWMINMKSEERKRHL